MTRNLPLPLLLSLLLLGGYPAGVAAQKRPAPIPGSTAVRGVVFWDPTDADQAEIQEALAKAARSRPDGENLRFEDASAPRTAAVMKRWAVRRADTPLLLLVQGAAGAERVSRRLPLSREETPDTAVRRVAAALGWPVPPATPPAPGVVLRLQTDNGPAELRRLVQRSGTHRVEDGVRRLDRGARAVYRLLLPEGLRDGDLRLSIGGQFVVSGAGSLTGPWKPLMDSAEYLGSLSDASDLLTPIADLVPLLRDLPGPLYLEVRAVDRGTGMARLAAIEVVARKRGTASGEDAWRAAVLKRRQTLLAAGGVNPETATPLGGRLTQNAHLTREKSPYLLTNDLTVEGNVTLRIDPGVRILTAGRVGIACRGAIVAPGTKELPISVGPAQPRQPDDWTGLRLLPRLPQLKLPGSVLSYWRITGARQVLLADDQVELTHSIIERGQTGLSLGRGARPVVRNCRILNCLEGIEINGGGGEVTLNEILGATIAVRVLSADLAAGLRVTQNSFIRTRQAGVSYQPQPGSSPPPLVLSGNYWGELSGDRLLLRGTPAGQVTLEPMLKAPPVGAGPG